MKRPIAQFVVVSVLLTPPIQAQEAIEIEIDSVPVEVEIQQPVPGDKPEEPGQQTAETPEVEEEATEDGKKAAKKRNLGIAIAVGAVIAGALAALGGGGGGGGGSATSHSAQR